MNSLCRILAVTVAVLFGSLTALPAAESAAKPLQPERWLLIVDCSAAMEHRAKAVEGVVGELLVSGMNGQMQPGDEIGLWTFNKQIYPGVAPLLHWDSAHSNSIAGRTVQFLSQQVYQGKPRLDLVLAELPRLVRASRQLTVVLLSDGSGTFSGTPFDAAINAAYTNNRPALAHTRMPLVTVLRAYHGKFIGQNVSFAPWPIEFPPFPGEAKKPEAAAPKPAVPLVKPVEPVKNIIIGGGPKTSETNPPAPVETKGGSANLLKPAETPTANATLPPPAQPVETIAPLRIPAEPPPVVAPVKPAPIPQPAAPQPTPEPVELAKVEPLPAVARVVEPDVTPAAPAAPAVSPEPSAPPAVATGTVTARKWPLILGIACMWVAILVALVLARRARRARATSFITRSFDHHEK